MEENIEFDEELDLTTPECIEAIHSISGSYKPHWSGVKLHKFYEERELTPEQMRAMVANENKKAKEYLKNHAEEAQAFLEKGHAPPCPDMTTMLGMMNAVFPETQSCPLNKLYVRLEKKTGSKFNGVWTLKMDNKDTEIYLRTIENLWSSAIRFNYDVEESLDIVVKLVLKKLGIGHYWWQFWR